MITKTIVPALLAGLMAITFTACSDTKESLLEERTQLRTDCQTEAMELIADQDREGLKSLKQECNEKAKDLKNRFKALKK